ncbi:hypothetical protein H5410_029842 [Solanum commersonii]|uniref:Uncharacterized protein n=1 Tax=Solanum commersonii TaxID=4109 RepID=A0A9J5YFS3_SOLCO|nr:hypothetical protein H5410_029842 [Solanum commersonii]
MHKSVEPSQFCSDESNYKRVQQKNSSITYLQRTQNSIGYNDFYFIRESGNLRRHQYTTKE